MVRWRDGPRSSADLHDAPCLVVSHDHPTGITCEVLGRYRGNARTPFALGASGRDDQRAIQNFRGDVDRCVSGDAYARAVADPEATRSPCFSHRVLTQP